MNRLRLDALAVVLLSASFGSACGSSEPSPPLVGVDAGMDAATEAASDASNARHLVLLFTADEHSHFFSFSPELDDYPTQTAPGTGTLVGGVARRATVLARERAAAKAAGKETLTVSAGDNQMGTLVEVAFETDSIDYGTLAALDYDATTLGNHEFDFGPEALARSITAAKAHGGLPPIVASNLHFSADSSADDALTAHFSEDVNSAAAIHPYRVITTAGGLRGALKVGLFGYVGVNAEHVATNKIPVTFSAQGSMDEGKADAVLPKMYADLQPVVDKLRNLEKVDLVIGLSLAGVNDSTKPETGEDYQVAAHVAGIDVIVSGHAHNDDPKPIVVTNATSQREVLVLNASSYGRHVGRVDLAVSATGVVSFDRQTQALLPVDDKTIPDSKSVQANDAILATIEMVAQKSYLDGLFARSLGQSVAYTQPGSLYFATVGHTTFDVRDTHALLFLTADAQLAAVDGIARSDMAVQSAGVIRSGLLKGKTGAISAADAFAVVPLGVSAADGKPGYPLVRAYLRLLYIRAIFEFASSLGKSNSDYDLATAGAVVEYDCTRPTVMETADLFDPAKGRVMKIMIDGDHADGFEQFDKVIYDRAVPSTDLFGPLYSVVTSSYIAQFASDVGASLSNEQGMTTTIANSIVHRPDASEVKEVEAFIAFLHAVNAEKMALYDATSASKTKRFAAFTSCP